MSKEDKTDIFANYKPEVVEYDEEIDGSDEHQTRENRLSDKEDLLAKVKKQKASIKGHQETFRNNIRTENEGTK